MSEDRELWTAVRRGDSEAFGTLFERHATPVYNYCFRRTGDWALAEDLTSAVFLEAWRGRMSLQPESDSLVPWLLGVAVNLLRNSDRSLARYRQALARMPMQLAEPDFAEDLASRMDDELRMRRLLSRLGVLSAEEREVFTLCVWSEFSYEQAAAALAIPVGTVRSRLNRARVKLRQLDEAAALTIQRKGKDE